MIKPTDEQVEEFLIESNAIERVYQNEYPFALDDSKQAWIIGVLNFKEDFSIDLILGIHRRLIKQLNKNIAGKIRDIPVYVGNKNGYRECLQHELIRERLTRLLKVWHDNKESLNKMPDSTKEVFIKQWHVDFEGIHPFQDGNGRTGRIIMNLQRLSVGLPLLIIHEGEEQFEYYKWFK